MGRKKIEFSDKEFASIDYMAMIHCTGEEIAGVMQVDYDTLNRIIKEKYHVSLPEYLRQRNSKGRMSLRRAQWKSAEGGNVSMQIWLGKQWLGQSDNVTITQVDETVMHEIESLMEADKKNEP